MGSSTGHRRAATALPGGRPRRCGGLAPAPPRSWPRYPRFHTRPALAHHVTAPAPFRWARPRSCPRSSSCPCGYGRACGLASSRSRFLMCSWFMPAFCYAPQLAVAEIRVSMTVYRRGSSASSFRQTRGRLRYSMMSAGSSNHRGTLQILIVCSLARLWCFLNLLLLVWIEIHECQ